MPLEALRFDLTPVGLHYLLTHYDIPEVDVGSWRLEVDGLVDHPLSLSLDDLRGRPSVETAVTLECAGNGRALLEPHVESQPWLLEAVGTARWEGVPLASILEEAGVGEGAVEVLFTGLDRGVEGGEEQAYARSLALEEALRGEVLLAYGVNGGELPPQHGHPLRLVVPGWYGMTSVKWLARITVLDAAFDGYQMRQSYRLRHEEGDEGEPLSRMRLAEEAQVLTRSLEAGLPKDLGDLLLVGIDRPLAECRDELVEVRGRLPRLDGVGLRVGRLLGRQEALRRRDGGGRLIVITTARDEPECGQSDEERDHETHGDRS